MDFKKCCYNKITRESSTMELLAMKVAEEKSSLQSLILYLMVGEGAS